MKFTRLTNHSVPTNSRMRSVHQGSIGTSRSSGDSVLKAAITAKLCNISRGAGAIGRLSAITPTAAIRITAENSTMSDNAFALSAARENNAAPDTMRVAATTAMPPPCGVGSLCDERAFGSATA
jgi:hypothetical protein